MQCFYIRAYYEPLLVRNYSGAILRSCDMYTHICHPQKLGILQESLITYHVEGDIFRFQVNYLGLLEPLYRKCSPCLNHYTAIVQMGTFNRDSRWTLMSEVLMIVYCDEK